MKITSKKGYAKLHPDKVGTAKPIILEKVGASYEFKDGEEFYSFSQSISSMTSSGFIEVDKAGGDKPQKKEEPKKEEPKKEEPKNFKKK